MAIMDDKLDLFDAQALAGNTGATYAGNTIDLGPAKNWNGTAINPGTARGEPIYIHARVGTAAGGDTATHTVALFLQHATADSTASFSNLMNLNLAGAASMTISKLTAGKLIYSGALALGVKRYVRAKATIAGTLTAGTIDVWMDSGSLPKSFE
jgi:hypothetical protein